MDSGCVVISATLGIVTVTVLATFYDSDDDGLTDGTWGAAWVT